LPSWHREHATLLIRDEYLPALQAVQLMAACALLNLPCSQGVHAVWPVELCDVPGGQMVQFVAPVSVFIFPALHATHADNPYTEAYDPWSHAVQLLARGPEAEPGLQSVQSTERALEAVPEAQGVQEVAPSS
jgi:hypothetical protein